MNENMKPTDEQVREARRRLEELIGYPVNAYAVHCQGNDVHTILAALDRAREEVEAEQNYSRNLCDMILRVTETETEWPEDGWRVNYLEEELGEWLNWSIKDATTALRADLSKAETENARLAEELASVTKDRDLWKKSEGECNAQYDKLHSENAAAEARNARFVEWMRQQACNTCRYGNMDGDCTPCAGCGDNHNNWTPPAGLEV